MDENNSPKSPKSQENQGILFTLCLLEIFRIYQLDIIAVFSTTSKWVYGAQRGPAVVEYCPGGPPTTIRTRSWGPTPASMNTVLGPPKKTPVF